jgi:hypothetical protein
MPAATRDAAQLLIHQRQQLPRRQRITALHAVKDLGDVAHGSFASESLFENPQGLAKRVNMRRIMATWTMVAPVCAWRS